MRDRKEGSGKNKPISINDTREQILLDAVPRHIDYREVIRDSHHGFTKGKSCFTNIMALMLVMD